MQDVFNMIHASKCQEHQQPLERICIKVKCTHRSRGLCRKCPKLDDISEVSLSNLFDFIEEQDQQSSYKDDYRTKALLFQQFKRQRVLIEYHLDQIQAIIESAFYSISESFISKLRNWGIEAQTRQVDTQALGELLSKSIQTSQDQKLILKSNQLQINFNDAMNLIEEMKCIEQISINFQIEQEQLNKQQNQVYKEYKLSKSIKVNGDCCSLCFNHNETQIAVVVYPNKIQLFNDSSQQGNWILDGEPLIGHEEFIWQVQFNHNSTQLVSCDEKGLIIVYRKQLDGIWTIQDKLQRNESEVYSICFNHNSTLMASGSKDNIIQIYEFVNGKWQEQQILTEHQYQITMVCFNINSTLLASGSGDESIIIWELNNSKKWVIKQKLTGHTDTVHVISFNIESTQIVSGGYDYLVKVWSVDKKGIWGCSYTLTGHTDLVRSVQFNQQSNMIVSNSKDESVKIWVINQQNIWECAKTIQNKDQQVCGIIINKKNQIFISQKNQILIYDQNVS